MDVEIQTISKRSNSYGKLSWLFCILVFIVPFVYSAKVYNYTVAPKEAVIQISILLILTLWIVRGGIWYIPKVFPPLLIFIIYSIFTAIWASNPYLSLWQGFHWFVCSLSILIVANIINKEHLILTIYLSGVLIAVIGIVQYFGVNAIPQSVPPAATFANKNIAAHFVAICFLLGFYLKDKEIQAISSIILIIFLVIATSEGAILAAITGVLFLVGFHIYKTKRFKVWMLIAILIIPAGIYGNWTNSVRIDLWRSTARIAIDNPLGVGLGNAKEIYPLYKGKVIPHTINIQTEFMHGDWFQLIAELGIPGVVLMGLCLLCILKNIKKEPSILAALIGICVVAAIDYPLQLPVAPYIGGCLLGVISK